MAEPLTPADCDALPVDPTATHGPPGAQETPSSRLCGPDGALTWATVHEEPFHCSANGAEVGGEPGAPRALSPAVQQSLLDAHAAPSMKLLAACGPSGPLGIPTTSQEPPTRCSATGFGGDVRDSRTPRIQHIDVAPQETNAPWWALSDPGRLTPVHL